MTSLQDRGKRVQDMGRILNPLSCFFGSSEICLDGGQNHVFGRGNLLSKVHDSRRLESGWWAYSLAAADF